jgi:hypothetical protein
MSIDRIAIADLFRVIDNVGQLTARCGRSIEDVLVCESTPANLRNANTLSP